MKDWITRFDGFAALAPDIRDLLIARGMVMRAPAGRVLFGPANAPENPLLLLSGTVRVHHISESGREIVLYRVEAGQGCVLTTACLLAHEAYSAEGIAETDVEAVAIPREVFDDVLARSARFREFVFVAYSRRITDLFQVIDDVAFGRIDVRLAGRLASLAHGGHEVKATHQHLAVELGTAREVVSRQLQVFQRQGWITQARGTIGICEPDALVALTVC